MLLYSMACCTYVYTVCQSITMVDCRHIVLQKVEMGKIGQCLAHLHAEVNLYCNIPWSQSLRSHLAPVCLHNE